ncbi:RHS repeat-associated core domain-containing protein [Ligaoa zhengdingensis]|uniref:RHS repeat-associated core domain-containing protein n=1 Tax=Ligaoa zhengdingensis TaxID=2763658 RepID=UPI0031BB8E97
MLDSKQRYNVTKVKRYARGINAIYVESGDAKNYYLYNAHGDVVQLTDTTGTVTQEYEYDAFGNEQNPSANDTNPLRYCGEYFDAETGTIYLRARYYDPRIGRFTSADTVLQMMVELSSGIEVPDPLSLNRYTYCHNNPVMYVDQNGHWIIKDFLQWKVKTIDMSVLNFVQDKLSEVNMTYTDGFIISGSPGFWSFNFQVGIAIDTDGNMVIQYTTLNDSLSTGGSNVNDMDAKWGFAFMRFNTVTNAPTVDDLLGPAFQLGASYGTLLEGIPFGGSFDFTAFKTNEDIIYGGGTLAAGFMSPGSDIHIGGAFTNELEGTKINIFDSANIIYNWILGW